MRVNHLFCETFITDMAWEYKRTRLLRGIPALETAVFDSYPWSLSGDKADRDVKRAKFAPTKGLAKKKVFAMPTGGTYYVFKTFIVPMCTIEGIKRLCTRSTRPMFRDREIDCWTKRDRTVYAVVSIVMTFLMPPQLGAQVRTCSIQANNAWFTLIMIMNNAHKDQLHISLPHGSASGFRLGCDVVSSNQDSILAELRKLVYMYGKNQFYIPRERNFRHFIDFFKRE
jgi:hypothetical protein